MFEEVTEESDMTYSQESNVCIGDGTTCVECGKVFTHPFYFSTHISTHTNQRDFVVVGQCAMCGLVFSNPEIFAAHLISSQSRLENQVTEQDDIKITEDFTDANSQQFKNNSGFDKNSRSQDNLTSKHVAKEINPPKQESKVLTQKKDQSSEATDANEIRSKRKRKAPERFEVITGPQFLPIPTDTDPEVEAYLLSLKQMGLTVDPEAFSSSKARSKKSGQSSSGKNKSKKMTNWAAGNMGFISPFSQTPRKPSPKYEYLDSDNSSDEEIEIQPLSGKLTRGERLRQRLERMSQTKKQKEEASHPKTEIQSKDVVIIKAELDTNTDAMTPEIVSSQKADIPEKRLETNIPADGKSVSSVGIVKNEFKHVSASPIRHSGRPPSTQMSGGKNIIHRSLPHSHLNKVNTRASVLPQTVGKISYNTGFRLPSMNKIRVFQANSPANAKATGQMAAAVRFPLGNVRGRKANVGSVSLDLNVQKSSSLEDLKKNSRDNVQQMLQNVGMIAVTSSAVTHGKVFNAQKKMCGEISFPPMRSMGFPGTSQPCYPQCGLSNRPFRTPMGNQPRFAFRGIALRGHGTQAAMTSRNYSPRGRQVFSQQTFKGGTTVGQFLQGSSHGGDTGIHGGRGQQMHNHMRGVKGQNIALRGKTRPSGSVQAINSGRGGSRLLQKTTKPNEGSDDVIVIDDDDAQESTKNCVGDNVKSKIKSSDNPQKTSSSNINKGVVSIVDVDLDGGISNIEVIEVRSQVSPFETIVQMDDTDEGHEPNNAVDNDAETKLLNVTKGKKSVMEKADKDEQAMNNMKGNVDICILPGKNIDEWNVCLANNSHSESLSPTNANDKEVCSQEQQFSAGSLRQSSTISEDVEVISETLNQEKLSRKYRNPYQDNLEKVQVELDDLQTFCVSPHSKVTTEDDYNTKLRNTAACNDTLNKECSSTGKTSEVIRTGDNLLIEQNLVVSDSEVVNSEQHSPGSINRPCTEDNDRTNDNISSKDNIPQLPNIDVEYVCSQNITDNADQHVVRAEFAITKFCCLSKCVKDVPEEDEEPLLNTKRKNVSISSVTDNNSVNVLNSNISAEKTKTPRKENFLRNKELKLKTDDTSLSSVNCQHVEAGSYSSYSCQNSKELISEEESSLLPERKDMDTGTKNNGESQTDNETKCSTQTNRCKSVPHDDSKELVNEADSSEASLLQPSPSAPATFAKNVNNLLDIFTEIEKTCKEMEENVDESQIGLPFVPGDVNNVLSEDLHRKFNVIITDTSNAKSSSSDAGGLIDENNG